LYLLKANAQVMPMAEYYFMLLICLDIDLIGEPIVANVTVLFSGFVINSTMILVVKINCKQMLLRSWHIV
jgi:hypothetical protein